MKKTNNKGFTIVELVIVIAVIAILAAVLIPTFSGIIRKANDSAVLQEARNIYTEYTAEFDYSAGGAPAQNLVIKVGDKYVAVLGAKMQDEIYSNKDAAVAAANSATTIICDAHTWTDGTCTVCGLACEHAEYNAQDKCTVCGKAKP